MTDHISAVLDGELYFLHPYKYCTIDARVPHPLLNHDNLTCYHGISIMTLYKGIFCTEICTYALLLYGHAHFAIDCSRHSELLF